MNSKFEISLLSQSSFVDMHKIVPSPIPLHEVIQRVAIKSETQIQNFISRILVNLSKFFKHHSVCPFLFMLGKFSNEIDQKFWSSS